MNNNILRTSRKPEALNLFFWCHFSIRHSVKSILSSSVFFTPLSNPPPQYCCYHWLLFLAIYSPYRIVTLIPYMISFYIWYLNLSYMISFYQLVSIRLQQKLSKNLYDIVSFLNWFALLRIFSNVKRHFWLSQLVRVWLHSSTE